MPAPEFVIRLIETFESSLDYYKSSAYKEETIGDNIRLIANRPVVKKFPARANNTHKIHRLYR
jgi:hypothetical protein